MLFIISCISSQVYENNNSYYKVIIIKWFIYVKNELIMSNMSMIQSWHNVFASVYSMLLAEAGIMDLPPVHAGCY